MKRCTKCGEDKPHSDYTKCSESRDGLGWHCKACRSAANRARYAANREEIIERAKEWNHANRERRRSHGYDREKKRARQRGYYAADPEAHRQKLRAWHHDNPAASKAIAHRSRLRKIGRDEPVFTPEEWEMLCAEYDHRCAACGSDAPLTVDHVIPVSRHGPSTIDNIQPLCRPCNNRKASRIIDYRRPRVAQS